MRLAARYLNYLGMPGLMLPTSMYQKDMKIIGLDDIPNLTEIMMIADLYTSGSYPLVQTLPNGTNPLVYTGKCLKGGIYQGDKMSLFQSPVVLE